MRSAAAQVWPPLKRSGQVAGIAFRVFQMNPAAFPPVPSRQAAEAGPKLLLQDKRQSEENPLQRADRMRRSNSKKLGSIFQNDDVFHTPVDQIVTRFRKQGDIRDIGVLVHAQRQVLVAVNGFNKGCWQRGGAEGNSRVTKTESVFNQIRHTVTGWLTVRRGGGAQEPEAGDPGSEAFEGFALHISFIQILLN